MRTLRHLVSAGCGLAGLALAVPASAVVQPVAYGFDLTNNNTSIATSALLIGNSVSPPAVMMPVPISGKNINMTMTIQATAWNATIDTNQYLLDSNGNKIWDSVKKVYKPNPNYGLYVIKQAIVGDYVGGLGVTSREHDDLTASGCGIGDCMTHQIDNFGNAAGSSSIDFIRLDFNHAVTLGSITRTAYAASNSAETGTVNDDDFSWGKGSTVTDGMAVSNLTGIFTNNVGSNGSCTVVASLNACSDTSTIISAANSSSSTASTTWYIAASILTGKDANGKPIYGSDLLPDSFKLAKLTAYYTPPTYGGTSAVPEPSSWMTMIAGFGIAGSAMRRARRRKAALAA